MAAATTRGLAGIAVALGAAATAAWVASAVDVAAPVWTASVVAAPVFAQEVSVAGVAAPAQEVLVAAAAARAAWAATMDAIRAAAKSLAPAVELTQGAGSVPGLARLAQALRVAQAGCCSWRLLDPLGLSLPCLVSQMILAAKIGIVTSLSLIHI